MLSFDSDVLSLLFFLKGRSYPYTKVFMQHMLCFSFFFFTATLTSSIIPQNRSERKVIYLLPCRPVFYFLVTLLLRVFLSVAAPMWNKPVFVLPLLSFVNKLVTPLNFSSFLVQPSFLFLLFSSLLWSCDTFIYSHCLILLICGKSFVLTTIFLQRAVFLSPFFPTYVVEKERRGNLCVCEREWHILLLLLMLTEPLCQLLHNHQFIFLLQIRDGIILGANDDKNNQWYLFTGSILIKVL